LDNTKGILNRDTEAFAGTTLDFLKDLGLEEGDLTDLRAKLTAVQDKERLIWEVLVPEEMHYCTDCTTEKYREEACHFCDYAARTKANRKYCSLGHTTVVVVRKTGEHNTNIMIGDHFRTTERRPTR
jgi:hypothetical protein